MLVDAERVRGYAADDWPAGHPSMVTDALSAEKFMYAAAAGMMNVTVFIMFVTDT